jgi:RNA polymerase sigma-70 factor (ECF subfamily)
LQPVFDAGWRRRALSGDVQAVDQMADAVLESLYRFAFYRVGRNRHLCEEVVQETLVRALGDLVQYEPERAGGNILPWLTGLARNQIQRVLAREKSAASLQALWERMDDDLRSIFSRLEAEPLDESVLAREETREMVNATMSQIPAHYRETLEAKYVRGSSVRDIATARRTSEKAIESQLSRARRAFRETFLALTKNLGLEAGG